MVKIPCAMWETWFQSLVWEDPLEKGKATHSSIRAWRILMDREARWGTVHGVAKSQTSLMTFTSLPSLKSYDKLTGKYLQPFNKKM